MATELPRKRKSSNESNLKKPEPDGADNEEKKVKESLELVRGSYWITRVVFLRYLAFIYLVAFCVSLNQNKELIGADGLLPLREYLQRIDPGMNQTYDRLLRAPTVFWWVPDHLIDNTLDIVAYAGIAISSVVMLTGCANMVMLVLLWILYHSIVNVGQVWFSFGWESQLLETGFLAIWCVPFWRISQLPASLPPSNLAVWGYRWLIFRIMLGAGLIKIRGDRCWHDLTCMNYFYETQPNPNPLAYFAHQAPNGWHAFETFGNHVIELLLPFLTFLPFRWAWITNGCFQIFFQLVLISLGNLSFLNWLTIAPSIWYLDDRFLSSYLPRFLCSRDIVRRVQVLQVEDRVQLNQLKGDRDSEESSMAWIRRTLTKWGVWDARTPAKRAAVSLLIGSVLAYLSTPIVLNLLSPNQVMNTSFDPLRLVNTYGAFGHVTKERIEVVIEGTDAARRDQADAVWKEYEFKCKPGDVNRVPCLISPYHYRLDWLMWFAPMQTYQQNPWILHLMGRMMENDNVLESLIAHNPFEGKRPPRFVRALRYRYQFTRAGSQAATKGGWWKRRLIGDYVPPIELNDLTGVYSTFGWRLPRTMA